MSLSHDSFAFFSHSHQLVEEGQLDVEVIIGSFFGVDGESHITDAPKGHNLSCLMFFDGYNSMALLQADLNTLKTKRGTLTGTLTETLASTRTFAKATFLGYRVERGPFLDGSGVNAWTAFVRLFWRKRDDS